MADLKPATHAQLNVVPTGTLRTLAVDEIKPSTNNPRTLFDPAPLAELKKNIAAHGVLVPLTVYQAKGQAKFSILDGERRYRCVLDLTKEGRKGPDGRDLRLPANVVEPPTKLAGLLYMFSIHNFREGWELMPTALSLKVVMEDTKETETAALSELTGLSEPQIERCRLLIDLPEKFQRLSLDPNPKTRIPSNFWIESAPVLDFAVTQIDTLHSLGRNRATEKLIEKYRAKKIKSVIHFRRVMDAYEISEDDPAMRKRVLRRTEQYFLNTAMETRASFDEFVVDYQRTQSALTECQQFVTRMTRLKLKYIVDDDERQKLRDALADVRILCMSLDASLKGRDDPDIINE